MQGRLPTFLVAGAARSGTTGLVEGLKTHPSVFVTHPKEPHYWGLHDTVARFTAPGDDATINRVAVTDRAAYLALYDGAEHFACRGDGSVSTLYYHEQAIPEIAKVNPDMKVIIMLRDPAERAFSAYQYLRARGFEPEDDFLRAVEQEQVRRDLGWHHLWHYTSMSLYADSVSAFLDRHGRDKVGVWFYDDLQADYESTVAQVLRFIGAPVVEGEAVGVPRVNISGSPRSRLAHKAIQAATRNEWLRRNVKRVSTYRTREFVRRTILKPGAVSSEDHTRLAPRFQADLAALAEVLQDHPRPLPPWLTARR